MSELDSIRTSVESVGNALDAARNLVLAAMNEAQDKAQQLAGLGLEGVTRTVMAAQSSLEAAASSLGGAHDAQNGAITALGEITNPTRVSETVQQLGTVIGQLDQTGSGVEAATASAQEAYTYAQQAEVDSVTAATGAVFDGLGAVRQAIQDAKGKAEGHRQRIEAVARK